jgi:hypothetical protein
MYFRGFWGSGFPAFATTAAVRDSGVVRNVLKNPIRDSDYNLYGEFIAKRALSASARF